MSWNALSLSLYIKMICKESENEIKECEQRIQELDEQFKDDKESLTYTTQLQVLDVIMRENRETLEKLSKYYDRENN